MAVEYEIKLLGVQPDAIRSFLSGRGVERNGILNFKRVIFDTIPVDPMAWIRLRSDGKTTTLTYKKTHSRTIDGTEEVEVVVDDFDETKSLLTKAGLGARNYQENTREVYDFMDCQVTIDTWPRLNPYVEVESINQALVEACVKEFDGLYERTTTDSTDVLYEQQGINLRAIEELKF